MGAAAVVLEAGQGGQPEPRVDVAGQLADRPGRAAVGLQVEQLQPGALGALGEEGAAEQLVAGAHGEDHRAPVDRPVQAAVGDQPLRGQRLRAVLPAAEQVDVGRLGQPLVGAHLERLVPEAAQRRPPGEDEQVAPIAVGGQQVRVDPDDPQVSRHGPTPLGCPGTRCSSR
jgi:hypothetical protein